MIGPGDIVAGTGRQDGDVQGVGKSLKNVTRQVLATGKIMSVTLHDGSYSSGQEVSMLFAGTRLRQASAAGHFLDMECGDWSPLLGISETIEGSTDPQFLKR